MIVGGGITGALCSYNFTKANVDTVLVDSNIIGYESTRANTALLQYEIDRNLIELQKLIGYDNAVACFKESAKALLEIGDILSGLDDDCDFVIKDCLFYSYKDTEKKFIKEEYDQRKKVGFDVEYFDESSAKEKFSFDLSAGIYSKKLAGEIDPYRFAHSLVRKSVENGLRVFENTEAVLIENDKNGIKITTQNGSIINAKKVVIATGYKARKYFKNVAIMTRTFDIVTKPIKDNYGWYNKCLVRDSDNPYFYIRSTADNRIIAGGLDEDLGGERSKMFNLCQEDEVSKDKYTAIFNKLKGMFSEIGNLEFDYGFSGFFGETKDGLPYIGEHSDYPNHYFCMAYGSNGIINAVMGSRLLKDLYLGNHSKLLDLFRLDR